VLQVDVEDKCMQKVSLCNNNFRQCSSNAVWIDVMRFVEGPSHQGGLNELI